MAYKRIISGRYIDMDTDIRAVIRFLEENFTAEQYRRPYFENLVKLGNKVWWVLPSTAQEIVDICYGQECNKDEIIGSIRQLGAGILIFRQFTDNRICIYLLHDLDELAGACETDLKLSWDKVEQIKTFSEMGIAIGSDLLGFKHFRRSRKPEVDCS